MGVPVPWYEVRILDENDVEVPAGEPGEICIRPLRPSVMMMGYWGNDSATLKTKFEGVYAVGDCATAGVPKAGVFAEGAAMVRKEL